MQISQRLVSSLAVVTAAAALVACAAPGPYSNQYPNTPTTSYPSNPGYAQFGRVTNVEYVRGGQSQGIAGAVVGGAVGGLAGNQVGGGSGRTAATPATAPKRVAVVGAGPAGLACATTAATPMDMARSISRVRMRLLPREARP